MTLPECERRPNYIATLRVLGGNQRRYCLMRDVVGFSPPYIYTYWPEDEHPEGFNFGGRCSGGYGNLCLGAFEIIERSVWPHSVLQATMRETAKRWDEQWRRESEEAKRNKTGIYAE